MTRRKYPQVANRQFGALKAVRQNGRLDGFETYFCYCSCGAVLSVRAGKLLDGTVTCCTPPVPPASLKPFAKPYCLPAIETSAAVELRIWRHLLGRAEHKGKNRVLPAWRSFSCFLSDVGPRPSAQHKLARLSTGQPWFAANVHWVAFVPKRVHLRQPGSSVGMRPAIPLSELARMVGATNWRERLSTT